MVTEISSSWRATCDIKPIAERLIGTGNTRHELVGAENPARSTQSWSAATSDFVCRQRWVFGNFRHAGSGTLR